MLTFAHHSHGRSTEEPFRPSHCSLQGALSVALQRRASPAHSAYLQIPKNLRMMYVHAWQSYIWNLVVSERVKLHGCTEPILGDLVLIDGENAGDGELEADGPEAPVVESLDPNLDDGALLVSIREQRATMLTRRHLADLATPSTALSGSGPLSSARAQQISRIAKARPLAQADLDAKTYTIFDVVLPLPGYAVTYPEGSLGERYREIMRSDKIDPDDLFRKQKEYSLVRLGPPLLGAQIAHLSILCDTGRCLPQDHAPPLGRLAQAPPIHLRRTRPRSIGRGRPSWSP